MSWGHVHLGISAAVAFLEMAVPVLTLLVSIVERIGVAKSGRVEIEVLGTEEEIPGTLSNLISLFLRYEAIAVFDLVLGPSIRAERHYVIRHSTVGSLQGSLAHLDLGKDGSDLVITGFLHVLLKLGCASHSRWCACGVRITSRCIRGLALACLDLEDVG